MCYSVTANSYRASGHDALRQMHINRIFLPYITLGDIRYSYFNNKLMLICFKPLKSQKTHQNLTTTEVTCCLPYEVTGLPWVMSQ